MPITLRLKQLPTVPLEAELVSPDHLANLSNAEIRGLIVYHGKRQLPLEEFFEVEGERSDDLILHGNMHKVRWLGRQMTRGSMTIHGTAGMHLGAYMKGGRIEVHGNAGDWIGAEMRGGFIRIRGNAGGQVGAAYRGAMKGMRGGTIVVEGSAGIEVGMRMRRGLIVVGGPVRDFAGLQMIGGTIILQGGAEIRTGAWMKRGTIVSLKPLHMMPTFTRSSDVNPTFMNLLAKEVKPYGVELPYKAEAGSYQSWSGDTSISTKGEILIWQPTA